MKKSSPKIAKKISIIGSGAWGCSIADLIAKNGFNTFLYVRKEVDHAISSDVNISYSFAESVSGADFIFIVTPSDVVLEIISQLKSNKKAIIVICSKGLENKSAKLFSQIIEEKLPNNYAILSGPNFASEIALEIPTITTIASNKKAIAGKVCELFKNKYFSPIPSDDVITTQISGAMKNIIAIGCGIVDGLKFGDNSKAALVVKGVNEIHALSKKMGGKTENMLSAAGFGDIFLTCSSTQSRNYSLGFKIGSGENAKEILNQKNKTYEGAKAVKSVIKLAKKYKINLDLCSSIDKILSNNLSKEEVKKIIHQSIIK